MEHYKPLSSVQWNTEINYFRNVAASFIESNGYCQNDIDVVATKVFQIVTKVDQRKKYFAYFHHLDISDFKELALYCFWIIKTQPLYCKKSDLSEDEEIEFESLNEKFALYYLIKKLRSLANGNHNTLDKINHFFTKQYIYELIYSFTYRDISKEAMILLVETIALALGYSPYVNPKNESQD